MDDLDVLARDFGLGARGKANPMRSAQPDRRSTGDPLFNDMFGGQPKYASSSNAYTNHKQSPVGGFDYDSIFRSSAGSTKKNSDDNDKSSSIPVYDKPVYDEDIFDGLPGLKSKPGGSTARFVDDDVFASVSSPATGGGRDRRSGFDELLGNMGKMDNIGEKHRGSSAKSNLNSRGFDDLLPGLGSEQSDANIRPVLESKGRSMPNAGSKHGNILDDPFIVLGSNSTPNSSSGRSTDPLKEIGKPNNSRSAKFEASSGGGAFENLDPLSTIGKSSSFSLGKDNGGKDESPGFKTSQSATTEEPRGSSSLRYSKGNVEEKAPADRFQEPPIFDDVAKFSSEFQKSSSPTAFSPRYSETGRQVEPSSTSEGVGNPFGDIWLVVSEVPLYTQPSTAPPPSRPPPPIPRRSRTSTFSSGSRKKGNGFSSPSSYAKGSQSPNQARSAAKGRPVVQFDELEEYALGRSQNDLGGSTNLHSSVETDAFSAAAASAAAMKDAMDKAEAKFRHAKEVREREHARAARNKESGQIGEDEQETQIRGTDDRLEAERKQKEEEEREWRRLEREKARQAVERATREARERAATEARERAAVEARMKAERTAVERANAEARERAERAAVQRAQAEVRERAAAEAKERAEKVAAEVRGRATAESREKELQERATVSRAEAEAKRRAERAAVERAAAEARERAAAQARERAASAAKMSQQKSDNDLESFFSMGRASSAPRPRTNTTDPLFEQQFESKGGSDAVKRTPFASGASSNMKKTSTTNFVDDLSSIFGAAPSGEFQEVEGEPEERRKARLERHQRTQERAAKALEEKNQRDLQAQREQEERHRIAETLDIEIKRWAAGKEGNLRALLSTLQYVLWPECGWQPVSLTDLISAASVKKVYRKATLCIHPDKVQQKGATLQQKYIAEKVFDLLKESWNRFNSEEVF